MNGRADLDRRRASPAAWDDRPADAPADVARVVAPLGRHWRVFVAVFVATLGAAILLALVVPKTYTTTTKLMAGNATQGQPTGAGDTVPLLNALIAMTGQQSAETYADLMQETPLADRVAADLGLGIDGAALLGHVNVKPVTNTAIVSLSVAWRTADGSARIANAFGEAFVAQQREFVKAQADEAVGFLEAEVPRAEQRMNDAQRAESQFEARNGLADIGTQTQAVLGRATALDARLGEARLAARQNAASLARVEQSLRAVSPTAPKDRSVIPNPGRSQLRLQRDQIALQLRGAEEAYTPAHPTVVALRDQLREIDRAIAREPQNTVGSATIGANPVYETLVAQRVALLTEGQSDAAQVAELERQRRAVAPEIVRLPEETRSIFALRRRSKEATDLYGQVRSKLAEAQLERTTVPSSVAVVARAEAAAAVVTPSLRANLLGGVGLALALALTAVFIANLLDRTLKSEADIEVELALPVLTSVPRLGPARTRSPLERAVNAEAFLQLFWSIRYGSERPVRSVTIVSASPGEGKSTVALNAASALAETHPGVLLVDADLRRPALHVALAQPRALGLSDVLEGTQPLEAAIHATARPGLFLLAAGSPTLHPTRLLQSQRFRDVIARAQERFAMVVVDTPALNVVYDGLAACVATDATVLVVASATTDARLAHRALRRLGALQRDAIAGVVLNRANRPATDYSSYFSGDASPVRLPPIVT